MIGKPARLPFVIGAIGGAGVWLLSPLVTGHAEPWDAASGYYSGALFLAGLLGSLAVPTHPVVVVVGIFAGQVLVLMGRVVADPASGGLWPLGILFLGLYSVVALVGAVVGSVVGRRRDHAPPG